MMQTSAQDLITAVLGNDTDSVKQLLRTGADPDSCVDDQAHITALHYAAQRNLMNIAPLLLEAGANPMTRTEEGATALEIARLHDHDEMIALLESHLRQIRH